MTPAILALEQANIPFKIHSFDNRVLHGYARFAAESLGVAPERVFKTLLVDLESDNRVVAVVPTSGDLDLKALAQVAGSKRARLTERRAAERSSGYVLGGISPFGQKARLNTFLDISAEQQNTIYVSGGRRGLEIEIACQHFVDFCPAVLVPLSRPG